MDLLGFCDEGRFELGVRRVGHASVDWAYCRALRLTMEANALGAGVSVNDKEVIPLGNRGVGAFWFASAAVITI